MKYILPSTVFTFGACLTMPIYANSKIPTTQKNKPNIVLIYADDIGYGDLSCYGANRVETPNTDSLAVNGVLFTNAHSAAATSTPSRYGLFTGEYPWRRKGTGVAAGDAGLIINPDRTTLPKLKQMDVSILIGAV